MILDTITPQSVISCEKERKTFHKKKVQMTEGFKDFSTFHCTLLLLQLNLIIKEEK